MFGLQEKWQEIVAQHPWIGPLWIDVVYVFGAIAVLVGIFYLLRYATPRIGAIAHVTLKEAIGQPMFTVLLLIGSLLLIAFIYIPYYTFGEDIAMLESEGLTLIKVMAIILAVWTASVSISEEVEGKTAIMVLSKPVRRHEFILGKYVGVLFPVAILFIVLGGLFIATVSYKVVYDAGESSRLLPTEAMCEAEIYRVLPGLALEFMQAMMLTSIAVAVATRLPLIPNLVICTTFFALGHLIPIMVSSAVSEIAFVSFVGNLVATVTPVLDHFSIETAIATRREVPATYLGTAGLYCLLYCAAVTLVALFLFDDRDLA